MVWFPSEAGIGVRGLWARGERPWDEEWTEDEDFTGMKCLECGLNGFHHQVIEGQLVGTCSLCPAIAVMGAPAKDVAPEHVDCFLYGDVSDRVMALFR